MWCVCTIEYYAALMNDEIMQFTSTWIELKDTLLNKVSQKDKHGMIALICCI